MDVLGMRSKAGIKWDDTRRSFRAFRGNLDVAILDEAFSNAELGRSNLLNWRICERLYAPRGEAYLGPNGYVISKLEVFQGSSTCLKTNTLPVLPNFCLEATDNVSTGSLCNKRQSKVMYEKVVRKTNQCPGLLSSCSNPLYKPDLSLAKLLASRSLQECSPHDTYRKGQEPRD